MSDESDVLDVSLEDALAGVKLKDPEPEPVVEEPKGEVVESAPPAPQPTKDEQQVPLAALTAERERRQAAERELTELRKKPAAPDPIENPAEFAKYVDDGVDQRMQRMRIELQQELMRGKHDDYDDKEKRFMEMAQDNPALLAEAAKSGNVARFAYETAMKAEKFERMQNVDQFESELRKKIEAEIRANVEKEFAGKAGKAAAVQAAASMPSLATVGSGGVNDDGEIDLTTALGGEDPIKRKRR